MDALDLDDAPSNDVFVPPAFKLAKLASYEIKAYPPFSVVKNKQSVVVVVVVVVDGKRMGEIVRIRPLMGSVSMSGNRFSSSLFMAVLVAPTPEDGDPSALAAAGCWY